MNVTRKSLVVGGMLILIAVFASTFFADVYLTTRRQRVFTAICIPINGTETRFHFAAPRGRYIGWFSATPELRKSTSKPHSKPPEVDWVGITMGKITPIKPEVTDYGSFTFDVPKGAEFLSSELVVVTTEAIDRRLYLNIRPSF